MPECQYIQRDFHAADFCEQSALPGSAFCRTHQNQPRRDLRRRNARLRVLAAEIPTATTERLLAILFELTGALHRGTLAPLAAQSLFIPIAERLDDLYSRRTGVSIPVETDVWL